jgi:hypothetical protein
MKFSSLQVSPESQYSAGTGTAFGLRRQIDGKHHRAAQRRRVMAITPVPAAETAIGGDLFERLQNLAIRRHQKWITERMLLPSCISSKAWLMSSSPWCG